MRSALILLALLNGLALNANAQSTSSSLPDLPQQTRDDIARVCLPVQYQSGAQAYRSCVQEQIVSRGQVQRLDSVQNAIAGLTFDERYAIQQACGADSSDSAVRNCTADQVAELNALPAPRLDELSSDEQYVMQQTCFPAQSRQGAAAYRQCQINAINSIDDIPAPDYAALSAVDRNSLQLKCSALESELANYRRCVLDGTTSRGSSPAAEGQSSARLVANVASPTIRAEEQAISASPAVRIQTNSPTSEQASNNLSIAEPAAETVDVFANDSDAEEPVVQRPTPLRPRFITAPSTSNSVAEAPLATIETSPEPVAEPIAEPAQKPAELAAALPQSSDAVSGADNQRIEPVSEPRPQAQSSPEASDDSINEPLSNDSNAADTNTDDAAGLENNLQNRFDTVKQSILDAFTGLSTQGKLLLAAIIAMPLALWAILAGRQSRSGGSRHDHEANYSREDLKRRVRAVTDAGAHDNDRDLDDLDDDPISASWAAEADSLFDDPPTIRTQTDVPPRVTHNELAESDYEDTRRVDPSELPISPAIQTTEPDKLRGQPPGFAGWLHTQPRDEQASLAIEFLIYWLAYGDERYEPSMKVEIFQKSDPSNHDIVKRWVLKEDVHAFADVVDWLQRNTTQIQKEQIVRFLMALLVNGDRPTPVQNTLLRFLSDAFYLADPTLEDLFEIDFGAPLPQTPRVDRMAWWDKQDTNAIAQWNARNLNAGDKLTRHAAQLGVDGDASAEEIEVAFDQALSRCNPDHFEHLNDREHQLLNGRLARLTQSRDELMEALV